MVPWVGLKAGLDWTGLDAPFCEEDKFSFFFIGKSPNPDLLSLSRNSHPYATPWLKGNLGKRRRSTWRGPTANLLPFHFSNKLKRVKFLAGQGRAALAVDSVPCIVIYSTVACFVGSSTVRILQILSYADADADADAAMYGVHDHVLPMSLQ